MTGQALRADEAVAHQGHRAAVHHRVAGRLAGLKRDERLEKGRRERRQIRLRQIRLRHYISSIITYNIHEVE